MNSGEPTIRRSPIFCEILGYLADHPEAQDTVEGIMEWWLLEQRIKIATTEVRVALEQLVAKELLITREGRAERVSYRVNRQKLRDLRDLL